eukprot:GDKI01002524.1.p1 GENE.GDKI01002524.1~~GDKI01002524.1.p1  ORF type:complete len:103 (+),score=27.11 GDKI01002524.1:29-310(+)
MRVLYSSGDNHTSICHLAHTRHTHGCPLRQRAARLVHAHTHTCIAHKMHTIGQAVKNYLYTYIQPYNDTLRAYVHAHTHRRGFTSSVRTHAQT